MREHIMFGHCLEMTREISMVLGEGRFHIHDRVENLGGDPSPLMVLYHTNPGWPLLDRGTRLVLRSQRTTEWTADREVGPEVYTTAAAPRRKARHDVYVHRPRADRGRVHVGLVNDRLELGMYWRFPIAEIPLITQWQHFHRGSYVTGIEPGNCSALGRAWNRANGSLEYLEPGAVRDFHLEMGVLDGAEEIQAFERRHGPPRGGEST